jgi:orotidine-5'-phosphate decarboxylase
VLARTSNPEGVAVQAAATADGTVARSVVREAAERNAGATPLGPVGVVIGATLERLELDISDLNGPILAPGFGAQGATVDDLRRLFGRPGGTAIAAVLPSSSRDVLRHGPDQRLLRDAARRIRDVVASELNWG